MVKYFNNFINEFYKNPYNPNEIWDKEIILDDSNDNHIIVSPHNYTLTLEEINDTFKNKIITFYGNNGKKYEYYKFINAEIDYDDMGSGFGSDDDWELEYIIFNVYKKGLEINKNKIIDSTHGENPRYSRYSRFTYYYEDDPNNLRIYKNNDNIFGIRIDPKKPINIEN